MYENKLLQHRSRSAMLSHTWGKTVPICGVISLMMVMGSVAIFKVNVLCLIYLSHYSQIALQITQSRCYLNTPSTVVASCT